MVRLVAQSFVPVALNADRFDNSAAADFFRRLQQRWSQGLWVVTPAGETLGFHYFTPTPGIGQKRNNDNWAADTVRMLQESAAKAGNPPPRAARAGNPFPDRGVGLTPAKGARLAAVGVPLWANGSGQRDGPPAIDSVPLSAADLAALHPAVGGEFELPAATAARFAPAFSPFTDKILVPQPGDVTEVRMTGRVVRADATGEVIRFSLRWGAKWDRDGGDRWPVTSRGTAEGVGVWDRQRGEWVELLWVLKGELRNGPGGRTTVTPFAGVVEWQREKMKG